jgi:hypothetical protein
MKKRVFILENLNLVDKWFFNEFGNEYLLVFANCGDQKNDTVTERIFCMELGIELIDGIGEKFNLLLGY